MSSIDDLREAGCLVFVLAWVGYGGYIKGMRIVQWSVMWWCVGQWEERKRKETNKRDEHTLLMNGLCLSVISQRSAESKLRGNWPLKLKSAKKGTSGEFGWLFFQWFQPRNNGPKPRFVSRLSFPQSPSWQIAILFPIAVRIMLHRSRIIEAEVTIIIAVFIFFNLLFICTVAWGENAEHII